MLILIILFMCNGDYTYCSRKRLEKLHHVSCRLDWQNIVFILLFLKPFVSNGETGNVPNARQNLVNTWPFIIEIFNCRWKVVIGNNDNIISYEILYKYGLFQVCAKINIILLNKIARYFKLRNCSLFIFCLTICDFTRKK